MAASPVTGDLPSTSFRRSSSNFAAVPQRSLSFHEKAILAKDDAEADILYTHPSVRIYHFQPPTDALANLDKTAKTLPDADYPIDAIEILPWRSRTETLSARAKLVIEKVQGSVHFLKCGSVIHTIMRNSQCWCVDGESKFVMRIGRLRYQRIEMPTAEPEDKKKVEEFKEVISKILKFEKTPCPFLRTFQIDLPEDAITPRRRGTWKRKESLTPTTPDGDLPPMRRGKTTRTMSMRGMPPSSFPSRSMTQIDLDRPRTASTPSSHGRFSFPDVRSESPSNYTSGEEGTDSERHDSASDRAESSHNSEVDESDRETSTVPIIKSPLKNVETLSPVQTEHPRPLRAQVNEVALAKKKAKPPIVASRVQAFNEFSINAKEPVVLERRGSLAAKELADTGLSPRTRHVTLASQDPMTRASDLGLTQTESEIQTSNIARVERHKPKRPEQLEPERPPQAVQEGNKLQSSRDVHNALHPNDSIAEETQDPDTTDTDSLYEQLKAEVQREVERPDTDQPRVDAINGQIHELLRANTPRGANPAASSYTTQTTVSSSVLLPNNAEAELSRLRTNDDNASTTSVDSFHTTLSDDDVYDLVSIRGTLGQRPFSHRRELSELTVTAETMQEEQAGVTLKGSTKDTQPVALVRQQPTEEEDIWLQRRTPGAFEDENEIRQRLRHRQSLSRLPSSSMGERANRAGQNNHIPAALLQKAATLAIVKPLEVVMLLVHIFGRIAQGATVNDLLSGDLFRRPAVRRTASGTFEENSWSQTTGREDEDEDDYAMPLRRKTSFIQNATSASSTNDDDAASFGSID
ncbi:hypothetical protein H2198_003632 [Neophaeococcomyces mojaviensis]|uniref:Uncharacterized protein n=1 Tax=Neophaeococcomyces mojaviensis TaxID=3383035 RepID=A0ACC3AB09_9EURO|nr:hypothetical protein H2198_003632 [Knufia sp. JES_112]